MARSSTKFSPVSVSCTLFASSAPSRLLMPAVEALPSEIWHDVLSFLDVEDVVVLERTCRYMYDAIASRHFWLKRLHELDQVHAPDLPPHVPTDSLIYHDLRDLVVRARRRVLNCTGSSSLPSSSLRPLRISREVIIPIVHGSYLDVFGKPLGWGADTLLVPGRRYFLMKWPAGYLQCWDVESKECMWTYPDVPNPPPTSRNPDRADEAAADGAAVAVEDEGEDMRDMPDMRKVLAKCCFACDVRTNGDVHVAVISEMQGDDQRTLEILGFSEDKSVTPLYQTKPEELDVFHGLPVIIKLLGDVVLAYTEGYVVVTFWKEDRTVVITNGIFDALEIVDDYIIGVTGSYDGNSLVAIPLSALYHARTTHVQLANVAVTTCRITPPTNWLVGRAQLSVCNFHWRKREEGRRRKVVITVLGDVYNEQNCCDFPVAEFFSFSGSDNDSSSASSASDASDARSRRPTFTPLGHSKFTDFNPEYSMYSVMTPPSQAGSTVLAFYDDRNRDETRFARTLATFLPPDPGKNEKDRKEEKDGKEVAVRVLDDAVVRGTPATFSLNVEFYSGAVHYVTRDLKSVVIRYLD